MAGETTHIDISKMPELLRIAEQVRASHEPLVLGADSEDVAVIVPATGVRSSFGGRTKRGAATSADDPLRNIVGLATSDGPGDVAENRQGYLAEAYAATHE